MRYLQVRNWDKWQSYRTDRGQPPWIKVHRTLLRDPEWVALPDKYRAHLISIWLLAADRNGLVPNDAKLIRKLCQLDASPNLERLQDDGWLTPSGCHDDATMTPQRRQLDHPETEAEKRREETDTEEGREVTVKELPVNNLPATNNRPPPSLSIEEKDKRMTLELFNSLSFDDRQDFEVYYRKYHHTQEPRWRAMKDWFKRNMKDNQGLGKHDPLGMQRGISK